MRTSPNIIITGTPGVGKTIHCEQLAQETGLQHMSINDIAKQNQCCEEYDEELQSYIVNEDKLIVTIENDLRNGGYIIDWHGCDCFSEDLIDLVVVLRCPSTEVFHDRLSKRGYSEEKIDGNVSCEIFGSLLEEAQDAYDEEIVVELVSETCDQIDSNCERIAAWVDAWKEAHSTENSSESDA